MDTYLGRNDDPITLHKYLYGNVDPVNNIDPTGNFSIGGALSAVGTVATLAGVGEASFDITTLFLQNGTDVSARDVGGAVLLGLIGGKILKPLAKACKSGKNGNTNKCKFAVGWVEADFRARNQVRSIPNSRLARGAKPWRIIVTGGAFDAKRGRGTAATNGPVEPSSVLQAHGRKFGLIYGGRNACGTRNTVGRCAEWRAARNLIRKGSIIKNIRWTPAYYVDEGSNGFAELGSIIPPCKICQTAGFTP